MASLLGQFSKACAVTAGFSARSTGRPNPVDDGFESPNGQAACCAAAVRAQIPQPSEIDHIHHEASGAWPRAAPPPSQARWTALEKCDDDLSIKLTDLIGKIIKREFLRRGQTAVIYFRVDEQHRLSSNRLSSPRPHLKAGRGALVFVALHDRLGAERRAPGGVAQPLCSPTSLLMLLVVMRGSLLPSGSR